MEIEYQQALVFGLAYILFVIICSAMLLIGVVTIIKTSLKCKCEYDWGKTIEGELLPRCEKCNEPFKVI